MGYQTLFLPLNYTTGDVNKNYTFSVQLVDGSKVSEWHDCTFTLTDVDTCYWLTYSIKDSNNNIINNIIEKEVTYTITLTDRVGGTYSIDLPADDNISFTDNGNGTFDLTVSADYDNYYIPLTFKATKNNVTVTHTKNIYVKELRALEPLYYDVNVAESETITPIDVNVTITKAGFAIDYIITELP